MQISTSCVDLCSCPDTRPFFHLPLNGKPSDLLCSSFLGHVLWWMIPITWDINFSFWFAFFSFSQGSTFPFSYKQLTALPLLKMDAVKTPLQLSSLYPPYFLLYPCLLLLTMGYISKCSLFLELQVIINVLPICPDIGKLPPPHVFNILYVRTWKVNNLYQGGKDGEWEWVMEWARENILWLFLEQ